jgi:sterol desaturase/sphingolipid hydroxylase (fatty acid hydroxylase superfamily)
MSSYLRGASMVLVSVSINTLVLTGLQILSGTHQFLAGENASNSHQALAILDLTWLTDSPELSLRIMGYVVATLGIACAADFFYYWMHRAQHRFGWMWRFHRVHHSIVEMNATNSYHHVAEDVFQFVAVTVPMSYLLGVQSGPVPWLVVVLVNTHSYFIHSTVNLNIGLLRYLISDNRLHRIHHSVEDRHFNRNFATSTPLWDVLFGTAYFPKGREWPAVGLTEVSEPRTIRDFLFMPFWKSEASAPAGRARVLQQ